MNWQKYRIAIGVVVLAVLVGGAVWAANSRGGEADITAESFEDELPDLDKNELDELEIRRPDGDPILLAKKGDSWRVVEPVDAEADESAVNTALDKLVELEVTGVAATRAKNHERLEVADGQGVHVIAKAGGKERIHLVVGAFRGGSTMVRKSDADEVLSVSGSIKYAFNKEIKNWRNRKVVDVGSSDVVRVEFESEEGRFHFARGDEDEWEAVEVDPEIEELDPSKVKSKVSSLSRMRAVDFAGPEVTTEQTGLADATAKVTLVVREQAEPEEADGGTTAEGGAADAVEERIVIELGRALEDDDSRFYARRVGKEDVIYVLSKHLANRIRPSPEDFEKGEDDEDGAGAPIQAELGGGGPGGKGQQLPPEVMKQLQQQMKMKQQMGGHP